MNRYHADVIVRDNKGVLLMSLLRIFGQSVDNYKDGTERRACIPRYPLEAKNKKEGNNWYSSVARKGSILQAHKCPTRVKVNGSDAVRRPICGLIVSNERRIIWPGSGYIIGGNEVIDKRERRQRSAQHSAFGVFSTGSESGENTRSISVSMKEHGERIISVMQPAWADLESDL